MTRMWQWVWIRIHRTVADSAWRVLADRSDELHREALMEPGVARSADLRAEADHLASSAKELREALYDNSQPDNPEGPIV